MKAAAILATMAIVVSTSASAGTWSSGGGNAVVCRNQGAEIVSAELLDLYEGRVLRGLSYPPSAAPYVEQAVEVAKRISNKPGISLEVAELAPKMAEKFKFLPSGAGLKAVEDSFEIVAPKGCEIVQTARYELDDTIYVDSDVWAAMNEQNRAALLMHETLYWMLRLMGERSSQRTRATVAHAFAGTVFSAVDEGLPAAAEICTTEAEGENGFPWASFATYPTTDQKGVVLQFFTFAGNIMLAKTTMNLVAVQWPLSENKNDAFQFSFMKSIIDTKTPVRIRLKSDDKSQTGFIDSVGRLIPPSIPFRCGLVQK